jgi:hypothetical protein
MTVLTMTGKRLDGSKPKDPRMMVRWDTLCDNGKVFKGSLRTVAHMDSMSAAAERKFGTRIHVIQPPYNTGVAASAGTHDFDCCSDIYIPGVGWWTAQRFLRARGFGCWYRHPPLFGNHIHGFTLPGDAWHFATRVGIFVPGQLTDYHNHAFGLASQHTPGIDHSWFPKDIRATTFNLRKYIQRQKEMEMEYMDWSKASKDEFAADVKRAILGETVMVRKSKEAKDGTVKRTVKQAIARAGSASMIVRESESDVKDLIKQTDDDNSDV